VTVNQVFAGAGLAVAVIAVVIGLYISGPPSEQRLLRLDEQRTRDLRILSAAIDAYRIGNGSFPRTLDSVMEAQRLRNIPVDPVTGDRYDYEIAGENQYRLCASFGRPSEESARPDFWQHDAGRWCFTLVPRANPPGISPGVVPVSGSAESGP